MYTCSPIGNISRIPINDHRSRLSGCSDLTDPDRLRRFSQRKYLKSPMTRCIKIRNICITHGNIYIVAGEMDVRHRLQLRFRFPVYGEHTRLGATAKGIRYNIRHSIRYPLTQRAYFKVFMLIHSDITECLGRICRHHQYNLTISLKPFASNVPPIFGIKRDRCNNCPSMSWQVKGCSVEVSWTHTGQRYVKRFGEIFKAHIVCTPLVDTDIIHLARIGEDARHRSRHLSVAQAGITEFPVSCLCVHPIRESPVQKDFGKAFTSPATC